MTRETKTQNQTNTLEGLNVIEVSSFLTLGRINDEHHQKAVKLDGSSSPVSTRSIITVLRKFSGSGNSDTTRCSELVRVPSLVEGCAYKHWLVLMRPPNGYPPRNDIVQGFIKTLAMALGRVHEPLTYKIRSLPDVRWVLPDSFLVDGGDGGYGGEPFVDGEVVPYDDKYHADWLRDQTDEDAKNRLVKKKPSRKRNNKLK
ncbi:Uncharacterized protein Rs2_34507 [Raphanus sativus]|nr:Uncharacterized protein Rs2_34507 [Raphanus sativus]